MVTKGCLHMIGFLRPALICFIAWGVQTLPCHGAVRLDRLGRLLTTKGYGGAELVDSGKFYHLPIRAEGTAGHLVVDTGSSGTLIFRSSVNRLGLNETRTREYVRGAFGPTQERYGLAMIHSFLAGNCTVRNVPVAIASDLAASQSYGRPNGLLGLRELMKFGAVLDLSRRMLYLRPGRPDQELADDIRSIMESGGWKAVSLTFARNHLRVPGEANDVPCHFLVDTGAYRTVLDRSFAAEANIATRPTSVIAHGVGGASGTVQLANLSSLWIGDYQIRSATASVLAMDNHMLGRGTPAEVVGLIGLEYLALNSAVFDFVSGTLYLRPRSRP
ncbi:MAG: retropepsin-like aspartic protease [Chthoniobacterales bacterium]